MLESLPIDVTEKIAIATNSFSDYNSISEIVEKLKDPRRKERIFNAIQPNLIEQDFKNSRHGINHDIYDTYQMAIDHENKKKIRKKITYIIIGVLMALFISMFIAGLVTSKYCNHCKFSLNFFILNP